MIKTMTSRERILAAYAHKEVDHVPCAPRIWAWIKARHGKCGHEEHLKVAEEFGFDYLGGVGLGIEQKNIPGVTYREEKYKEDVLTVIRSIYETPDGVLTGVIKYPPADDSSFGVSPNPFIAERLIKGPEDLKRICHILPDESRFNARAYFDGEKIVGDRGLITMSICSPITTRGGDQYPMESMMIDFHENRAFFDEVQNLYHQQMLKEIRFCLKAGVRHFFANWYYNSMSCGWSPTIWKEAFAPQLKEATASIHAAGGTVNYYDDGKLMAIIDILADCGIDVLQTLTPPPVGDVDLAEVKRRIGKKVCLMGHIDLIYVIQRGTPEIIEKIVKEAIEIGAPGGGFILGSSDSIREGTPEENVRAYFDAARKYGSKKY